MIAQGRGDDDGGGPSGDPVLADWVEELTARLGAGESVDLSSYARRHPEKAERLRRLLPAIALLADLGRSNPDGRGGGGGTGSGPGSGPVSTGRVLDDFRIVREVGRGGMGVVFEARQISLDRRVALKVLPFASALDDRLLARFRKEAQVAAQLHHTNIVPVYAVGCAEGVSYYAMQFIAGRSLAELIADLRREARGASAPPTTAASPTAGSGSGSSPSTVAASPSPTPAATAAGSSAMAWRPVGSIRSRAHARAAAGLALQAAQALAAAHDAGVIHRDVKPANLMVDDSGHLWVTDFGVARLRQNDDGLTLTGDLLGTLKYMSPEQALGRRAQVDHRSDLYGLGMTLYELLTLRPAFRGAERPELLRRILDDEPTPPGKLNPSIPRDLETIVLNAIAKEPSARYASAHALAEDLRRFLDGRPILADRPGPIDHALKWARRRWALVATAAGLLALSTLLTLAGLSWSNARLRTYVVRLAEEKDRADRLKGEEVRLRLLADRRLALSDRHLAVARLRLARQALEQGQVERAQDILDDLRGSPLADDPRDFAWNYVETLSRLEVSQIGRHESVVVNLVILGDGRRAVYGIKAGDVVVAEIETGRVTRRFAAGEGLIRVLADRDGRRFVTIGVAPGQNVNRAVYRDAEAGGPGHPLDDLENPQEAAFFLGGRGLAASTADGWVRVYEIGPGASPPAFRARYPWAEVTSPSERGEMLRFAGDDGAIDRIDALTGARRGTFRIGPARPALLAMTPDGRTAVGLTAGPTRDVVVVDLDAGVEVDRWASVETDPAEMLVSDDGRVVVLTSLTGPTLAWDRRTGRRPAFRPAGLDRVEARLRAFLSRDGRRLALSSWGKPGGQLPVRVFDLETGEALGDYPGRPLQIGVCGFSGDGRTFLIDSGHSVKRWRYGRARAMARSVPPLADEAWSVAFTPDGRRFVVGGDDTDEPRTIQVRDADGGRVLSGWKGGPATVSALAVSPDGALVATGALEASKNLRLWDLATGGLRAELVGHADKVRAVAFSPGGSLLASAGSDRTARFWDVPGRRAGPICPGPQNRGAVAFSPAGDRVAVADEDGLIVFLDPIHGRELGRIYSEDREVRALAFSPDGQALAAAGMDATIRLWDMPTGQELLVLAGHTAQVNALAFSPDGRTLVSVAHDGGIRLWESREPDDAATAAETAPR